MEYALTGIPLHDALVALATSNCPVKDIYEPLIWIGDMKSMMVLTTELGNEKFWESAADKGDSTMLVAPVPIYYVALVRPSNLIRQGRARSS